MLHHHYMTKLCKYLSQANDEHFINLLWASNALQSDYYESAFWHIKASSVPPGAITTNMTDPHFIQKWELETLANELMTTKKDGQSRKGKTRHLDCTNYSAIIECVNTLRKLENAEHRNLNTGDIKVELGRIAARQFSWQRGFVNLSTFYRNIYIYGQGKCAKYFEDTYGLELQRFTRIGFMLYASFTTAPFISKSGGWEKLGTTWEEIEKVLALIAQPFSAAATSARLVRKSFRETPNKPSVLRKTPCLRFGDQGHRIRAPLPELIMERIASGLFYDLVGADGGVRNEYGDRFEQYCFDYFSQVLTNLHWEREFGYSHAKNTLQSPDIIATKEGDVTLAIECKTSRMSHEAAFGADPSIARGYDDLAKAVYQLWKFFSHCRRSIIPRNLSPNATGIVLTLDNWLVMSESMRDSVIENARAMAAQRDTSILAEDQKEIIFLAAPEMEIVLSRACEESFLSAAEHCKDEKFKGWRFDTVHSKVIEGQSRERRPYLFKDQMKTLLPWWGDFSDFVD